MKSDIGISPNLLNSKLMIFPNNLFKSAFNHVNMTINKKNGAKNIIEFSIMTPKVKRNIDVEMNKRNRCINMPLRLFGNASCSE